ncbi:MAG TPA: hypothetical protein DDY93_15930 [Dehalococcoidia bacterium]|nr:hypothetical protein [Dehalococcoidia bacterium]
MYQVVRILPLNITALRLQAKGLVTEGQRLVDARPDASTPLSMAERYFFVGCIASAYGRPQDYSAI